jgi:hypothetical protein
MPRRKKLKVKGSAILDFSADIKSVKSKHVHDAMVEILDVRVHTSDGEFAYEIYSDDRAPDLGAIKNHIESSIAEAKKNFLTVEVSEYAERDYLFFDVQSIGQKQYSGHRV